MTAITGYEFYCWLEGVLDMSPDGLSADQVAKIREKMKSVKSPQEFAALDAPSSAPKKPDVVARC